MNEFKYRGRKQMNLQTEIGGRVRMNFESSGLNSRLEY